MVFLYVLAVLAWTISALALFLRTDEGGRLGAFLSAFMFISGSVNWLSASRLGRALWRHAAGCCYACGYDLRGSPGRCPECGTPVPPRSPAAV